MYTEEEAKEKWCPQAIRPVVVSTEPTAVVGANRNQHVLPLGTFCVGSECMMWRWSTRYEPVSFSGGPVVPKELPKEQWTGYCRLGGKP